jgi:DNA polymerase-3 subunit gamma/tau
MRRATWTFVSQNAQVADYDGQRVLLTISTTGLAETFRRGAHAEYVRQALIDVLGVDARVEGVPATAPAAGAAPADTAAGSSPTGQWSPEPDRGPAPESDAGPAPESDAAPAPASPAARVASPPPAPAATPSWSEAPPPPETAPSWASPMERARAAVAEEAPPDDAPEHLVDDTAISDDDESIDELADVGVPVVERILGGTVIREEER